MNKFITFKLVGNMTVMVKRKGNREELTKVFALMKGRAQIF